MFAGDVFPSCVRGRAAFGIPAILAAVMLLSAMLPATADAALPPPPATSRATWWGADMGTINVSQHVFTRPGSNRLTISGVVQNGGVGGPRWSWTDSGWAASGIYQVSIYGPGGTVSYTPPADPKMSVAYSSWDGWTWNDIDDGTCPVPYEGWHGQPDVPGTNRFPTGKTFSVTYDASRTTPNQWIRVTTYFRGNIGYLHWGATASDYVAFIDGDTHLAVSASKTQVPADAETTSAIIATLTDDAGAPIPGETVHLALSDGLLGTVSDAAPTTDASGQARTVFTPKHKAGTVTVTATQDDESASAAIELTPVNTIKGVAADGHGHALVDARLELFEGAATTPRETAVTGEDGSYEFEPFQMAADAQYAVKLGLQDRAADPSNIRILWGAPNTDAIYAKKFVVKDDADTSGTITRDFDFSNTAGMTLTPGMPPANMDDLAVTYFHTKQAFDFWTLGAGVTLDKDLPEDVVVGQAGNNALHEGMWAGNHDIYIGAGNGGYGSANRPVNREWHEFAHHAQFDIYEAGAASPWPWHGGDQNHNGWGNECTADSWVEGWAEFFPSVMKDTHYFVVDPAAGSSLPWVYDYAGGFVDLELDQDYVKNRNAVSEEDVVARILWDFYDRQTTYPTGVDDDEVALGLEAMQAVLGQYRGNVRDLYEAFIALDDATVTDAQVDALFLRQGAYHDTDGDRTHDAGEPIGRLAETSRPLRESKPARRGTGVRLDLTTTQGAQVRAGTALVDVDYAAPGLSDIHYEQPIETTGTPVLYMAPPTSDTPALVTVGVKNTDDVTSSAIATMTPGEFWAAHDAWAASDTSATTDVIMTKTFTLPKASTAVRVTSVAPGGAATVAYGSYLTLTGELEPAHPGAVVSLSHRAAGSTRYVTVATARTSEFGGFSLRARPLASGTLKVSFGGDADHNAGLRLVTVRVTHRVYWTRPVSSVYRGGRFYFIGSVSPNHYRKRLALQRRTSTGSWSTVAYATLDARSRFRGLWKPYTRGTYRLRVVLASDTTHYLGESTHRTLTVR